MVNVKTLFGQIGISASQYVLGIVLAVALTVGAYLLMMTLYFAFRRKYPSAKYSIEISFTVLAMLLSVVVKLAVLPYLAIFDEVGTDGYDLVDYMGYAFSAIYSMIGGLSFEGLPYGVDAITHGVSVCLYYGSSILAGLIILSVITAKASYEIFSLIMINVLKNHRTVYVFNSLTSDSLLLAENIAEHHKQEIEKYKESKKEKTQRIKPTKALILFAGSNIPSFTRNDPLCREIMSQSFYYYSVMKGKDTKHSLLTRLGLRRDNVSILATHPELDKNDAVIDKKGPIDSKGLKTRICEFYFAIDEEMRPMQEVNTSEALSEIDFIINDFFPVKNGSICSPKYLSSADKSWLKNKLRVCLDSKSENADEIILGVIYRMARSCRWTISEQYVLVSGDTDYEYYTRELNQRIQSLSEAVLSIPLENLVGKSFILSCSDKYVNKTLGEFFKMVVGEDAFDKKMTKTVKAFLASLIRLNTVNEAYLSSISLLEERTTCIGTNDIFKHLSSDNNKVPGYRAMILGFGATGQSVLHALYYGSSHIDVGGKVTQFRVDVFDKGMRDIEGIFAKNHPLYHCYDENHPYVSTDSNGNKSVKNKDVNEGEINKVYEDYKRYYQTQYLKDILSGIGSKSEYNNLINNPVIINTINKTLPSKDTFISGLSLPKIYLHAKSCASFDFIEGFDEITGTDITDNSDDDSLRAIGIPSKFTYNIIVIAFGSDRFNISIANAIIGDMKRELIRQKDNGGVSVGRQCIAVNIRDKDNLNKLAWGEFEKELFEKNGVTVFSFGVKEDIYTYDKIINYSNQYEYNANYSSMSGKISFKQRSNDGDISVYVKKLLEDKGTVSEIANICDELGQEYCDNKNTNDYNELLTAINRERELADRQPISLLKNNIAYLSLNGFKKESNRAVDIYSPIMREALLSELSSNGDKLPAESIMRLLTIEHDRWTKFHIAHGWIYRSKKMEELKMHGCILPFAQTDTTTYAYDLINVANIKNQ